MGAPPMESYQMNRVKAINLSALFVFFMSVSPWAGLAGYFYGEVEKVDEQNNVILMRPIAYDLINRPEMKIAYNKDTEFLVADVATDLQKGDQISVVTTHTSAKGGIEHADTIRRMVYEGR